MVKPSTGCLFKAVNRALKLTNLMWMIGILKPRRLAHIDVFAKSTILLKTSRTAVISTFEAKVDIDVIIRELWMTKIDDCPGTAVIVVVWTVDRGVDAKPLIGLATEGVTTLANGPGGELSGLILRFAHKDPPYEQMVNGSTVNATVDDGGLGNSVVCGLGGGRARNSGGVGFAERWACRRRVRQQWLCGLRRKVAFGSGTVVGRNGEAVVRVLEMYAKEIEVLKEKVRSMVLAAAGSNQVETMRLIDAIQRLGMSDHFEKEIDAQLEQIFVGEPADDLYTVALHFRLCRQRGYNNEIKSHARNLSWTTRKTSMTSSARKKDTRLAPCVAAPFPKHKKVVDPVVASAPLPFKEDEEVVKAIVAAITPFYSLESKLGDYYRADAIRTKALQRITSKSLDGLPLVGLQLRFYLG
ncbi:hypothetical protein RJ640_000090 [Escallonia rubra]|uniref:Terpene synthase N-terminal domain-containing protein n=1 Tax=Escallonia rubra TaxID=112253 RepID=A0AA88QYM5_9ASTE|nr:hypothetical protein RJ640_000090 [Escallonia rubra]